MWEWTIHDHDHYGDWKRVAIDIYRDGWPLDSSPTLSISPALLQLQSITPKLSSLSSSSSPSSSIRLLPPLTAPALLQWTSDLITINWSLSRPRGAPPLKYYMRRTASYFSRQMFREELRIQIIIMIILMIGRGCALVPFLRVPRDQIEGLAVSSLNTKWIQTWYLSPHDICLSTGQYICHLFFQKITSRPNLFDSLTIFNPSSDPCICIGREIHNTRLFPG